jgi:hypothetical protein
LYIAALKFASKDFGNIRGGVVSHVSWEGGKLIAFVLKYPKMSDGVAKVVKAKV